MVMEIPIGQPFTDDLALLPVPLLPAVIGQVMGLLLTYSSNVLLKCVSTPRRSDAAILPWKIMIN